MGMMGHEDGSGHEHDGSGMMQQCMDMMNSMMGNGDTEATGMSSMGLNLPLTLIFALVLVGVLGYLLGMRRARA